MHLYSNNILFHDFLGIFDPVFMLTYGSFTGVILLSHLKDF